MCRACVCLLDESTKEVQPRAGLKEEGAFSNHQGVLHALVCTDKDCGTPWERSVCGTAWPPGTFAKCAATTHTVKMARQYGEEG